MSHVVVLLNETIKMNLIKAQDTKKAKENRSYELISQVQALAAWSLKGQAADTRSKEKDKQIFVKDALLEQSFLSSYDSLDEGSQPVNDPYNSLK